MTVNNKPFLLFILFSSIYINISIEFTEISIQCNTNCSSIQEKQTEEYFQINKDNLKRQKRSNYIRPINTFIKNALISSQLIKIATQ